MYLLELKTTLADSFERWIQTFGKLITMKEGWTHLKDGEQYPKKQRCKVSMLMGDSQWTRHSLQISDSQELIVVGYTECRMGDFLSSVIDLTSGI